MSEPSSQGDEMEGIDEDMVSDSEDSDADVSENNTEQKVYLPGGELQENEELICDESAYKLYHQLQTGAPCLSFDVVADHLGEKREEYPATLYTVCGTQADRSHANHVIVMRMSNLHKNKDDDDDDDDELSDEEEETEDEEKKPQLDTAMIKHDGGVNRIRCTQFGNVMLAATWSEQSKVHLWDLTKPLNAVNDSNLLAAYNKNHLEKSAPLFTFTGHQTEGFAMDWSRKNPGYLLTGDCTKHIHLWTPQESGGWHVDQRPFAGHTASVEDIQWSPSEATVFASCSVDRTIRIWDTRAGPAKACMLTTEEAHERDVNVISWNASEPFIVSGGDDGAIKIWDLRQFQSGKPVAIFKHHTAPITSVEWSPSDSSIFAASGSDDQLTLWDLAVERDMDTDTENQKEPDVPPQLLFIHQGQTDLKELHWHRQLPGVIISTAHSGFNIFKTISV